MVTPVVGEGSKTRGDEASEAWNVDDIGLVGTFAQHKRAAAVLGGIAHIEHLGTFLVREQLDSVEQVDARNNLIHFHFGAVHSQLLDDIIVAGTRDGHLDADFVQGSQQVLDLLGVGLVFAVEGPSVVGLTFQ